MSLKHAVLFLIPHLRADFPAMTALRGGSKRSKSGTSEAAPFNCSTQASKYASIEQTASLLRDSVNHGIVLMHRRQPPTSFTQRRLPA